MEIGINQAAAVKNLFAKNFIDVEIFKDLASLERVVIGKYTSRQLDGDIAKE